MKNKVCIQGAGYVGAAMAVAVASKMKSNNSPMYDVRCIDLPTSSGKKRINSINSGLFPFDTKDKRLLNELSKAKKRKNLLATSDTSLYIEADIVIVCINCDLITSGKNSSVDFDSYKKSILTIAEKISEDTLVIIESTVPPGTCEHIVYPIFNKIFKKRGLDINKFFLAHSYERVMPGENYFDSIINYWRVFSGINEESANKCEIFLKSIINYSQFPLTKLNDTLSSETAKVLENSYRATNIAFIEEWGRFSEDVGIDIYEIIDAIKIRPTHSNIMRPGFGVGGYCLTKDPLFAKIACKEIFNLKEHEFPFSSKAVETNNKMPSVTLRKVKKYFNDSLINKKILLMGVTYRQNIGDTRFSPSEIFFHMALKEGADIIAYDPLVNYWMELEIKISDSLPEPFDFDVIIFAVRHKEFVELNIHQWINDPTKLIFDANNVLTKNQIVSLQNKGYNFMSIGRG